MDFRRLEYFVSIAQLGSLTKASDFLGVSEPSLSRQLRLLEEDLKGTLFQRTGRGVRLTPAGMVFLEQVLGILESVKRARAAFAEANTGSMGRVTVGIPPRIARVLTGPLIETFRQELPKASINVVEGLSATLSEWLQSGRIEIALLYNQRSLPNVDIEPLCKEELVLVGSRRGQRLPRRMKFAATAKYPLILPAMPNIIRATVESACRQTQVQPDIVIESDTVQSILDLVRRNLGYSFVPRGSIPARSRESDFTISSIDGPQLIHEVAIATSRRHPQTQLGLQTCETIRALNLPALLSG